MQRLAFSDMDCPIARALDQIGDAWTLLILRTALMGARTFQDFEEHLPIPTSTLTRRLDLLCRHELLLRLRYQERPPRHEYVLTEKGRTLLPIVLALGAWGNRWLTPDGVAIEIVDARTGRRVEPILVDGKTREEVRAGEVALAPGPAASARLRRGLSPRRVLGVHGSVDRGAS